MNNRIVEKDERTIFIENTSYKYGYNIIAFALLIDVMYRSLILHEAPWDLLALIILSGFVMSIYQFQHKVIGRTWKKATVITLVIAFVSAFSMIVILNVFGN